ncbi:MAG: glycosyltransferase family 9 protein [Phycisphaerae bacterium]|nr:glycosyltransferase family 9 protein [Phycisphaerae bacterium]
MAEGFIIQESDNILDMVIEKEAEAARNAMRGLILQPGAIGDCILTLPLAEFLKDNLNLGGVDILGHTEYIGIFPGRTCVNSVRSIDSIDLHRLFAEADTFDLADRDALINVFSDYAWIVTFLGEPNSNFERNLIFTANCSRSVEVITLSMKPRLKARSRQRRTPKNFSAHITDFYLQQFIVQIGLPLEPPSARKTKSLIKATDADINKGRELLEEINVEKPVVIQPGSGGAHKRCHLDNFLAVAEELISKNIEVIFLLGPAEVEQFSDASIEKITNTANCLMDLSLTQVLELLSCASAFLGNDSGITHLASAMGVKTIVVFGPTEPAVYRPIGPAVNVITSSDADFTKKPSAKLRQQICEILLV